MRIPFSFALAALLVVLAPGTLLCAEPRLVIEETFLIVTIKGLPYRLEALVVKEAGAAARLPVALITHGQDRDPERREAVSAAGFMRTAREFARRGWLAVGVVRRGFGRSEGAEPYRVRGCRNGDFKSILEDQVDDLEAALAAIGQRHDADPGEAIALGVSVGGATVLGLGARNPPGLRAVVNVSGGIRVAPREGQPDPTCTPDDLLPVFSRFGERSKVPALWLYAQNDSFFSSDDVRRWHEAYVAGGGRTSFHMYEPIGKDGHALYADLDGMLRWIPELDRFLRTNKLRTFDQAALDKALKALNSETYARRLIARYHGRPTDKALAISQSNKGIYFNFGGADMGTVERTTLEACAARSKEPCRILLRNFKVVEDAPKEVEGAPPP